MKYQIFLHTALITILTIATPAYGMNDDWMTKSTITPPEEKNTTNDWMNKSVIVSSSYDGNKSPLILLEQPNNLRDRLQKPLQPQKSLITDNSTFDRTDITASFNTPQSQNTDNTRVPEQGWWPMSGLFSIFTGEKNVSTKNVVSKEQFNTAANQLKNHQLANLSKVKNGYNTEKNKEITGINESIDIMTNFIAQERPMEESLRIVKLEQMRNHIALSSQYSSEWIDIIETVMGIKTNSLESSTVQWNKTYPQITKPKINPWTGEEIKQQITAEEVNQHISKYNKYLDTTNCSVETKVYILQLLWWNIRESLSMMPKAVSQQDKYDLSQLSQQMKTVRNALGSQGLPSIIHNRKQEAMPVFSYKLITIPADCPPNIRKIIKNTFTKEQKRVCKQRKYFSNNLHKTIGILRSSRPQLEQLKNKTLADKKALWQTYYNTLNQYQQFLESYSTLIQKHETILKTKIGNYITETSKTSLLVKNKIALLQSLEEKEQELEEFKSISKTVHGQLANFEETFFTSIADAIISLAKLQSTHPNDQSILPLIKLYKSQLEDDAPTCITKIIADESISKLEEKKKLINTYFSKENEFLLIYNQQANVRVKQNKFNKNIDRIQENDFITKKNKLAQNQYAYMLGFLMKTYNLSDTDKAQNHLVMLECKQKLESLGFAPPIITPNEETWKVQYSNIIPDKYMRNGNTQQRMSDFWDIYNIQLQKYNEELNNALNNNNIWTIENLLSKYLNYLQETKEELSLLLKTKITKIDECIKHTSAQLQEFDTKQDTSKQLSNSIIILDTYENYNKFRNTLRQQLRINASELQAKDIDKKVKTYLLSTNLTLLEQYKKAMENYLTCEIKKIENDINLVPKKLAVIIPFISELNKFAQITEGYRDNSEKSAQIQSYTKILTVIDKLTQQGISDKSIDGTINYLTQQHKDYADRLAHDLIFAEKQKEIVPRNKINSINKYFPKGQNDFLTNYNHNGIRKIILHELESYNYYLNLAKKDIESAKYIQGNLEGEFVKYIQYLDLQKTYLQQCQPHTAGQDQELINNINAAIKTINCFIAEQLIQYLPAEKNQNEVDPANEVDSANIAAYCSNLEKFNFDAFVDQLPPTTSAKTRSIIFASRDIHGIIKNIVISPLSPETWISMRDNLLNLIFDKSDDTKSSMMDRLNKYKEQQEKLEQFIHEISKAVASDTNIFAYDDNQFSTQGKTLMASIDQIAKNWNNYPDYHKFAITKRLQEIFNNKNSHFTNVELDDNDKNIFDVFKNNCTTVGLDTTTWNTVQKIANVSPAQPERDREPAPATNNKPHQATAGGLDAALAQYDAVTKRYKNEISNQNLTAQPTPQAKKIYIYDENKPTSPKEWKLVEALYPTKQVSIPQPPVPAPKKEGYLHWILYSIKSMFLNLFLSHGII